jgi:bifunctional UDP-N-acetylglucosamine pyrophosphorylase/glucosamine-1-phosphate N-acetyltransferase
MMVEPAKRTCLTVILAAGEGKRMASDIAKVLHPVAGLPMVCHVMNTVIAAGSADMAVVVGHQATQVADTVRQCRPESSVHQQGKRMGTAHAVLAARDAVRADHDEVIILYGDVPLVRTETILAARSTLADGADIVVLGFETKNPDGYGRLLVKDDQLMAIREQKDANESERAITFCNSGILAFRAGHMLDVLDAIGNDNAAGEYYLTDAVGIGRERGLNVVALEVPEEETLGVNDRVQLAQVESIWQDRKRQDLMRKGVSMSAPQTVFFHHDTIVENAVVLEPNIVFSSGVRVEQGATIRAFSYLEESRVERDAIVGPYARLRPGAHIGRGSKVGNFVELKATKVGDGAKVNHLSYVGDTDIGEGANIGAGTITCNYDGFNKYKTVIGSGAFIGSNTCIIAPVSIGENANTAAGSVITNDIPGDALAIARSKQANLLGKAKSLRSRYAKRKAQSKK